MDEILLSICIPTYNREQTVLKNVQKYLEMIPDKVDIVVCDNGSVDNTYAVLSQIKDERLNLYRNDLNKGFTYNLMRVIREAKGKFVCLMSDEDFLYEQSILEVLEFLNSKCIQENVTALICETFDEKEDMTKIEELLNVMYGRVSYMSGIILNRSKMEEEDFEYTQSIYPHIGILLKMAIKGKIVFSKIPLIIKGKEAFSETEEVVQKDTTHLSYVHPIKRLEQLRIDSEMIFTLKTNDEIKYILMNKMFLCKLLQGTIVYELIKRNKNIQKSFNLKVEDTKDYLNDFLDDYEDLVKDKLGVKYSEKIRQRFKSLLEQIENVRRNRKEYDELVRQGDYVHILLGNRDYLQKNIGSMKEYEFKVDYICSRDNIDKEKGSMEVLQLNELVNYSKLVIVVSQEDRGYIERLYTMPIQEVHLFMIEDLALTV